MQRVAVVAIVFVMGLALAGCTAPAPAPTPSDTLTLVEPPQPTATVETPDAAPALPPIECIDYSGEPPADVDGLAELFSATLGAELASSVVLNPGVAATASADAPGMIDAVARICSTPMSRDELIESANAIALAIAASPIRERVSTLVVSAWLPAADGSLQEGESVTTEYQLHTWDAAAGPSNWQ